jgi:hypothetical protein
MHVISHAAQVFRGFAGGDLFLSGEFGLAVQGPVDAFEGGEVRPEAVQQLL